MVGCSKGFIKSVYADATLFLLPSLLACFLKFSRLFELFDYVVIRFICLDDEIVEIVEITAIEDAVPCLECRSCTVFQKLRSGDVIDSSDVLTSDDK